MFERYGSLEGRVAGRCKGAAGFRLRHDVHDFCVRDGFMFNDNRAVQVLAALGGNVDALCAENALEPFVDGFPDLGDGVAADLVAQGFAGAAADDYNIAFFEMRRFDEFRGGFGGVRLDLHDNILVVNFVSNACH